MTDDERATIVEVLCSLALSDHLGDVRDAEDKLFVLVGASDLNWDDPRHPTGDYSAWQMTKARLRAAGIDPPSYLGAWDDEDEDE